LTISLLKSYRLLKETIKQIPPILAWRRQRYERKFATSRWEKLFRGVFHNFEEAARSAPPARKIGYNHPEPANMCRNSLVWMFPSDYPVLFWLAKTLNENARIFDFGGSLGISFYSYRKYLRYPPGLRWTVYDLPEVVKVGIEVARRRMVTGLSFTLSTEEADGADMLLALSALQYVERPFASFLSSLHRKPAHLLLNKLPLTDGPAFITLQNIGTAFCPYHIFNRQLFIQAIRRCGYELIDSWENPEFRCFIPFHPERNIKAYSGLYFERTDIYRAEFRTQDTQDIDFTRSA
jgi:putative methyltransferase (TIGR04325 family)